MFERGSCDCLFFIFVVLRNWLRSLTSTNHNSKWRYKRVQKQHALHVLREVEEQYLT